MKYTKPQTIEEVVALLATTRGAVLLAGGTVLVPELTHEGGEGLTVIDAGGIEALHFLGQRDGHLQIGAMVTLARIAASAEVQAGHAALVQAAAMVGNPNIRRAATIGGNLAFGRPVADLPPALLALDAEVLLFGPDGIEARTIAQVITEGVPTARVITAVRMPNSDGQCSGFLKFAWRQASGKTIVNIAVALRIEEGRIAAPRLAVGGLCRHASRVLEAEQALEGRLLDEDLVEDVARVAAAQAVCDVPGPPAEDYRRRLVAAGVRRVLTEMVNS